MQVEELIEEGVGTDVGIDADAATSTVNNKWRIIVFNDEHSSFDWVIESFITVLRQGLIQAEQNVTLIHHTGKACVKTGTFDDLQPLERALALRGLTTELTND